MSKPKSKSVLELAHLPKDEQQRALIPAAIANPATMATAVRLGCEADFSVFACYAWNIAVPGVPRVWGKHHALICQALQALFEGQIPNNALMINLPPRHTKSTLASVLFPPWIWIKNPAFKILCSSMKGDLASRDAVNSRRLLESDWYRGLWQNVKIADDQGQKQRYQTTAGGHRVSVGVGVGTGDGGGGVMCFSAETSIMTDVGEIPIGRIVNEKLSVKIASFDHGSGRIRWNTIKRYESFKPRRCVRVRFSNGSVLEGTADHPTFIVGRGYVPLGSVLPGEAVVSYRDALSGVREACSSLSVAHGENQNADLQQGLQRNLAERKKQSGLFWRQSGIEVLGLRYFVFCEAGPFQNKEILFDSMRGCGDEGGAHSPPQKRDAGVRFLRDSDHSTAERFLQNEFLFSRMQEFLSFETNSRERKRSLRAWLGRQAIRPCVQEAVSEGSETRRECLPALCKNKGSEWQKYGSSPHRLRQDQRFDVESDLSLHVVPSRDTRGSEEESCGMDRVVVEFVAEIPALDRVYNLSVDRDQNYFANFILSHNCDDPSDIDDTDRETPLSEAVNWWNNTMSTRLDDYKNGWRMLVGQRIDCNDLFGNQIEIGGWSRLTLPAEYEPGQHSRIVLKNGNVIEDFRRIEGEPLWPERFGREELDKLKRGRSADSWLSLYQQRPNRQGGGAAFVDFNPDVHKKPCPYDPTLPICFSMDFNVTPFCCGVIQHHNGEVRVIREIELHGSETNKMCKEFLRIANQEGWKLVDIKVYGDPAGNQRRTSASGETDWSIVQNILGKYMAPWGLRIKNSTISVKNTVNAVRTRIRDASGVSHLLIDPQCSGLISNLLKATWPCRENLEPYHHLSWFRYFCDYEYSPVVPWEMPSMAGVGASSR